MERVVAPQKREDDDLESSLRPKRLAEFVATFSTDAIRHLGRCGEIAEPMSRDEISHAVRNDVDILDAARLRRKNPEMCTACHGLAIPGN